MDITQWSPGELETFSHKLEQVIHGPTGPTTGKVGFILMIFPLTDEAQARMMSNCDGQTCVTVLYKILQRLVDREPKQ